MRYVISLLLAVISADVCAGANLQVLMVHSYSQEYPWTKYQHDGFTRELASVSHHHPIVNTEYLDTKRKAFDRAYQDKFASYLEYKYDGYTPDLIYVTDDNALRFALSYFERLFPESPIIFSGVNNYDVEQSLDRSRITGVFEKKEIDTNIRLLKRMAQNISGIIVVGDTSNTYHAIERDLREALKQYPEINTTFIAEKNIETLVEKLQQRQEKFLFLTTLGSVSDATGHNLSLDETIEAITAAGEYIILSMEDAYLYDGVLGGYVTSGRQQGRTAASMALSFFHGTNISQLELVKDSPNEYIFDQMELIKHDLQLPVEIASSATILNPPATFYERNRQLMIGTLIVLVTLVFVLMAVFLVFFSLKNRQAQHKSDQISKQAAALNKAKNSLADAQQIAHLGNWEVDLKQDSVYWSDEIYRIFGEEPQSFQPTQTSYASYIAPEDLSTAEATIAEAVKSRRPFEIELRVIQKDGAVRYTRQAGFASFNDDGEATHIVGTILDITELKRSERREIERFEQMERFQDALLDWSETDYQNVAEALKRATEISARTLDVGRVGIWLYNDDHSALRCEILFDAATNSFQSGMDLGYDDNPAYFKALQTAKPLVVDDARTDSRTRDFTQTYLEPCNIASMLDAPIFYHGEIVGVVCHEQTGHKRAWTAQEQEFAAAISKSVSLSLEVERRRDIEKQLEHLAYHDELTDLPNRSLFLDRLDQAIKQAERYNQKLAVLFLDLDNFKEINDSLGHAAGDKVLVKVARILRDNLRAIDTIARLGGDEFTLIISNISNVQVINNVIRKLIKVLEEPVTVEDNELYITSSIGISIFPDDGTSAEALLRNADAAMYKAKNEGRSNYQFYTQDMTERAYERVLMESNLRRALEKNEFVINYQPQYDVERRVLVGMEALVRWQHPEMGLISPLRFIPLAEETGLIVQLDRWVMRTAMTQVTQWYRDGLRPGKLALNLAVKQLYQNDLIAMIESTLAETGFQAEWLTLEITEGEVMKKPEEAVQVLRRLSDMGIEIAIDDFGTGYSSLTHLKRLPVNKLKIDQSFVRDVPGDEEDEAIVQAVIALSRSMGLDVIAEGVETDQQLDFLLREGCSQIQGYLYWRPMDAAAMSDLLNDCGGNLRVISR